MNDNFDIRHATSISWKGFGVLIEGPAGSGKSSLALALMAYGADLVADDRTRVYLGTDAAPWVDAPSTLPRLIEARGVGLIPAKLCGPVPLGLIVDLSVDETARLPEQQARSVLGRQIDLLRQGRNARFAEAVLQVIKSRMGG